MVDLLNLDSAPGREQADACLSGRHLTRLCSILKKFCVRVKQHNFIGRAETLLLLTRTTAGPWCQGREGMVKSHWSLD